MMMQFSEVRAIKHACLKIDIIRSEVLYSMAGSRASFIALKSKAGDSHLIYALIDFLFFFVARVHC